MAEALTAVDGGKSENPNSGDNSKSRKSVIQECARRMREIQDERKSLNEDAALIRERLVENGIDKPSFAAALRIANMDDDTARDTYIDGLRESMEALGIGEQGSFFAEGATA